MINIVCLGNPGLRYKKTRHNAGFIIGDGIKSKIENIKKYNTKRSASYEGILFGQNVVLSFPQTFMNCSGRAVLELKKKNAGSFIIISDDVYLPVGITRLRESGSAGGHNGLKDIIAVLGSEDFPRIKIGVGEKQEDEILKDRVLSKFSKQEIETIKSLRDDVLDKLKQIIC